MEPRFVMIEIASCGIERGASVENYTVYVSSTSLILFPHGSMYAAIFYDYTTIGIQIGYIFVHAISWVRYSQIMLDQCGCIDVRVHHWSAHEEPEILVPSREREWIGRCRSRNDRAMSLVSDLFNGGHIEKHKLRNSTSQSQFTPFLIKTINSPEHDTKTTQPPALIPQHPCKRLSHSLVRLLMPLRNYSRDHV